MTGQPNNNTSVDVESGSSAAPPNPARSMHVKFGNPTVHEVPSSHEALSTSVGKLKILSAEQIYSICLKRLNP